MSGRVHIRREVAMDTIVTIQVIRPGADAAIDRAFGWFHHIEECCTRFDNQSEVMQLTARAGEPVEVGTVLFECVQFALKLAEETRGAFDPTVGLQMENRGFNQNHHTGHIIQTPISSQDSVSYRDVHLDPDNRTIALKRPLILDLGAVAKGLAIDMAARELEPFEDFSIDAGGDLYLGGCDPEGAPWSVGIRHPRRDDALIIELRASNEAVCTSADYARRNHILDPRTGAPADGTASVTVVAPNAMLADALATAAFVLGPVEGLALLERMSVQGVIVTRELERHITPGLRCAA